MIYTITFNPALDYIVKAIQKAGYEMLIEVIMNLFMLVVKGLMYQSY